VKVYLHSDRAERNAKYPVTVAPPADTGFVVEADVPANWRHAGRRGKAIPDRLVWQFQNFAPRRGAFIRISLGEAYDSQYAKPM
jgi:hypothetical protein